jgi:triosephosphate isomerase (TIM)
VSAKTVIGNWKMNGSVSSNTRLLSDLLNLEDFRGGATNVAVCVPALYVEQVRNALRGSRMQWGVQDISEHPAGAYTGEISAQMASDFDVTYALVGHSERRTYHHESDEAVARKAMRALEAGITPIICVGETLAEHDSGETEAAVEAQLSIVLDKLSGEQAQAINVAYEPVWAIGTGRSASAEHAQSVHAFLRQCMVRRDPGLVSVKILYGGSLTPDSAAQIFSQPDIDGGLVGGASLRAQDFDEIIRLSSAFSISRW